MIILILERMKNVILFQLIYEYKRGAFIYTIQLLTHSRKVIRNKKKCITAKKRECTFIKKKCN